MGSWAPQDSPRGGAASAGLHFWEPSFTFGGQKSLRSVSFLVCWYGWRWFHFTQQPYLPTIFTAGSLKSLVSPDLTLHPGSTVKFGEVKYQKIRKGKHFGPATGCWPHCPDKVWYIGCHLNNKQNKNTSPIISRQDYHLTQPCPSEQEKKRKNTEHKSHPIQSLHKPWTNIRRAETKRKKEFNLEDWENETSNTKS